MIAGKTIGDVFWLYLGGGFEQYAAQAVYAPIDDAVSATSYDLKQFFPESVECLKYKGKLFALPWTVHVGSASATYYNKDLLQKAGVAEPKESWTWDECIEATKKLTNASAGQWGMFMSNYYAGNPVLLARGQGGDLLSKDGTKCTLSAEETRKGLQIFSDLFSKWKVNPMSTQMVGSIYQMFAANKVAMFQSGFWGKTVGDYVAPGSWGVVLSPYGPKGRGQTMFVDMVGVTSGSKYVKEAFTYMTELCSYDAGMDIWQVRKSVPGSRPDVWNSEAATKDAHFKIYADGMKKDGMPPKLPLPVNFREKEYWAAVDKGLEPITLGEKTLDQVMDGAVKSCQEVLDKASLVR
jgi:multiple sugar transport system substrate-binding protein